MSTVNLQAYVPFDKAAILDCIVDETFLTPTRNGSAVWRSRLTHKNAMLFLDGHELNAGIGVSVQVSWREHQGALYSVVELIK